MSEGPSTGVNKNAALSTMHRDLVGLSKRLEEAIDQAPDAASILAITTQIGEVNARVTATGRLLLVAQSHEISRLADAVRIAIPNIEREIEALDDAKRMVSNVTAVLRTVDETLRVAAAVAG